MSKFKTLIDEICNDNDYLFDFQVQPETKELVRKIIKLRDGLSDCTNEVEIALDLHITILNENIKKQLEIDPEDENYRVSYLNEILSGLLISKERIVKFNQNNGLPRK